MTQLTHRNAVYDIRVMSEVDLDAILAHEQSAHTHPWTRSHFVSSINSSHQCWVMQLQQDIVAYAITSTAADEAELLNITVVSSHQRKGLGKLLLNYLCQSFGQSIHTFFLEVRESNEAAIALYDLLEFNELGMRPNYYPAKNGRENALIMGKALCN